jgi:ATP-binding cassette, subfamily B, bacterial PglK
MRAVLVRVSELLTPIERRQALLLVPLVIAMAAAEVAGIASVFPFLSLMAEPEAARAAPVLAWAYSALGFEDDRSFLVAVGLAVIAVMVSANAFLAMGSWILTRFGTLRVHSISRRLLVRYLQQPYAFFLARNSASLTNNVLSEVGQVVNGVVLPGLTMIAKSAAAIAIIALVLVIDPLLASLVALVLAGTYGVIFLAVRNYLERIGRERVAANQRRHRAAREAFGGIKELRLLGREREMARRYAEPSLRFAQVQATTAAIGGLPRFALEAIAFSSIVAIVLALLATGREVAEIVPVLGLYAFAGYRLMPALQQVFASATAIRYSTGALDEVHTMFTQVDASTADLDAFVDPATVAPLPFADRIRFAGVAFRYETSEAILRELDFEIPVRCSAAFVGPTGAGKTTAIDLLLGLLEPTTGSVTVDGVPLSPDVLPRWRRCIGHVPQTIYLTDDTVTRNIAFGLPDDKIDHDAVRRAAQMAQIDAFIETELPRGYDTVVGERGVRLSGGQRQRIGIARALYHDPDVIVFDEATSALDGATERSVYQALRALAGRKTMITIAHRLSTVRSADRIFVLDRGHLVGQGTYEELYDTNEVFRAMADGVLVAAE